MKGHTGASMLLGKGGIYSGLWKQRLVAHSSTKSELIGVYDTLPQVLWTKQFLEEQGWRDSAMERNGQSSSMKQTKHMNIRYFYVTEQVKNKAIHVTHYPTEEMVGDFFMKPLQGSLFIKMHNYIMGSEEPGYQALPRSVLRDHDAMTTRKQNFIGTWKHDSEAAKTSHEHMNKDLDGSTRDMSTKNMQGTSTQIKSDDEESIGDDNTKEK